MVTTFHQGMVLAKKGKKYDPLAGKGKFGVNMVGCGSRIMHVRYVDLLPDGILLKSFPTSPPALYVEILPHRATRPFFFIWFIITRVDMSPPTFNQRKDGQ